MAGGRVSGRPCLPQQPAERAIGREGESEIERASEIARERERESERDRERQTELLEFEAVLGCPPRSGLPSKVHTKPAPHSTLSLSKVHRERETDRAA